MPKASPIGQAFNSGELSPRMAGRVGTAVYETGCHALENFIPDIAGPAVKRGGTAYVSSVKTAAARSWLARFELTASASYLLEFGNGYIRFYKNRAPVTVSGVSAWVTATAYIVGDLRSSGGVNYYCKTAHTSGATFGGDAAYWHALTGSVYEVPTPYTTADLVNSAGAFAIDYEQSGDTIYLVHGSYPPKKLERYGETEWVLTDYTPTGGPFKDLNLTATTIQADAATGNVTLTASAATFTAAMVGQLVYLEQPSVSSVLQWETSKAVLAGAVRRRESRNYEALNGATTGTVQPTHTEGAVYDGDAGVQWQFLDAGYGWARITAYTSPTQVDADVLSRLPGGVVSAATTKWALGAWSAADGYPTSIAFFQERLVFSRGQTVWMSVAGDYENMSARDAGRQLTDSAIILTIPSRRGNSILWLETLEVGLFVGTGSDEWLVSQASRNDPLGPLNIAANAAGAIGSRSMPALRLFESIVFCQRSGKKLRAVKYLQGEGALYNDLNAYADHAVSGAVSLAYVQEPYSLIFVANADGTLSSATYYPEQEVLGWSRYPLTGAVECVQSLPSPDGTGDDLWLIVRRTVNGATVRYVEWMKAPLSDIGSQEDAFYVDSGVTYSGAATTTVTGLSHLEGQTVAILTNGATHPTRTVSGGSVSLQISATKAHVGLPYTAKLVTMDIEAGSGNGTSQGKLKRAHRIAIRLLRTLGGKLGVAADLLDTLQFRTGSDPMNAAPPLFTGDKGGPSPGNDDRRLRVWFVHEDPLPATVVAILPQMTTEDA